jgi:hypothetical protein
VVVPRSVGQGRPQLKRPEDIPQEKPPEPKKKKVKGPRAVAILQLTSSGKGTLIPIAILVDGKFYDAGAYKADPVPMALDSGTVYEAEQGGESQGLFTVHGALHSQSAGSQNLWVGTGSYLLNGTAVAKTAHKAEDVPVGLDNSSGDEPPRLTRHDASKAAPADSKASTASTSGAPAGSGSSDKPASDAPPTLSRPSGSASGGASAGPDAPKPAAPSPSDKPTDPGAKEQAPKAQTTSGQGSSEPASPGQAAPAQAAPAQAAPAQAAPSGASQDYYRPTLRRGKPTTSAPEEPQDEPAPKAGNPGSPASTTAAGKEPVKLVPAISDGGGPDPRAYTYFWKTGEEEERRNQMLALAADDVRAYTNALVRNYIPAKPPAVKAGVPAHKAAVKPVQPVFENIQFHVFDVWVNNQPVMILSAEAHLPPVPGTAAAPDSYSVTLVVRTDIYGNLRKLYSGVTDKFHLDVTAQLELIDVVDADGDGRGELLFRETTDAGGGYVIYRATPDKLWKMFDSLGQ